MPTRQLQRSGVSLEYLRLMHEEWLHTNQIFGNPYDHALLRLVLIGWMEERPFDQSDLAESCGISRQQVMRRPEHLLLKGDVELEKKGNRVLVHPSVQFIDRVSRQ